MDRAERVRRVEEMLRGLSGDGNVESLMPKDDVAPLGLEGMRVEESLEYARNGIRKIVRQESVSDAELFGLEAIILPRERPVVFVLNDSFGQIASPWTHFSDETIRRRIEAAIPSIGRVELPGHPRLPYGGTGFVVGPNLIMTNRHVAELFARGLGQRDVTFRSGLSAALDFKREKGTREDDRAALVSVRDVVMIHPFWDMAILRVEGLPAGVKPLSLSIDTPRDLLGRDVAVVGYPARDDRNDLELQDRIFERTYYVKRLQPGKIRERERIDSFGNQVNAVTHDSSTLGGNSGSAVLDVGSGRIVGLHFAGIYLKNNYAVPMYELARDNRIVDAGLNFAGSVEPTNEWLAAWRLADPNEGSTPATASNQSGLTTQADQGAYGAPSLLDAHAATWTIPLSVMVSFGAPSLVSAAPSSIPSGTTLATTQSGAPSGLALIEAMRIPIIHDGLQMRAGYQPEFLALADEDEVSIPQLTESGKRVAAKLEDGSTELKYHKFSVVMHKKRRLALFTAANVDWRESSRLIDGRKPTRKELSGLGPNDVEQWVTDGRIPEDHQLPDLFFTKDGGHFDKGHLVRRDDICWGDSFDDIQIGNGDTYHTTNCSPQVASFNQSAKGEDNWGDLENLVQKQTRAEKAIIFSGPVLAADDPTFVGRDKRGQLRIQVPRQFWKIIVVKGNEGPEAFGFTLEQDLSAVPTEFVVSEQWKRYMLKISAIERLLNKQVKLSGLKRIDQFESEEAKNMSESLGN